MTRHIIQPAISAIALSVSIIGAGAAGAATSDIIFEPPALNVDPICITRASDQDIVAEWSSWDGKALPKRAPELIKRDIRRLSEMDARKWFDTIVRMVELLPTVDPHFSEAARIRSEIDLLVATGQMDQIRNQRLVEQLIESDLSTSPRLQALVAEFLIDGIGIDRDEARGLELLISAGYSGNADALLEMSRRTLAGDAPEGWDLPPDLAITMAFGALVGQLNPMICDRVTRIAREFRNGDIVTQNYELSEQWFKFAADLGDANAAWNVAEYHMRSEVLRKDNDTLLKYLTLAAEGGLPYAELALGRLYEVGSLVAQDMDRALDLYRRAADGSERSGLVRLSLFLEQQSETDPSQHGPMIETLEALAELPDAPGWTYTKLAQNVLERDGRWAGEAEAGQLLERAAALEEGEAIQLLSAIRMRHATTDASFYRIVDDLIYTISQLGMIDPMADLRRFAICKAPSGPNLVEAEYWRRIEAATGTQTLSLQPDEMAGLAEQTDDLTFAILQTQALYGRPTALASFMELLDRKGTAETQIAFWDAYAERYDRVLQSRGNLVLKMALSPEERTRALTYYRDALTSGEYEAGLYLADVLLSGPDVTLDDRAEALELLMPLAGRGRGEAIALLHRADPVGLGTARDVFELHREIIEARGDFWALTLALRHLDDTAQIADYKRRIISAMDCDFKQAIHYASVLGEIGHSDDFYRWIDVAQILGEDNGWRNVLIGDHLRRHGAPGDARAAMERYETAYKDGNLTSISRLLNVYANSRGAGFDAARAAQLFVELIRKSDLPDVPHALARLAQEEPGIRMLAAEEIDVRALYETSALAGHPVAMRELARIMRSGAGNASDIAASTDWFKRAADLGDVPAMVDLAQALVFGIGIDPSREQAQIWLARAADAGDETAQMLTQSLALRPEVTQ